MKRSMVGCILLGLLLTACGGGPALPLVLPTVPPTPTPLILQPTGTILWITATTPVTGLPAIATSTFTSTPSPTATSTLTPEPTYTSEPSPTGTPPPGLSAVFSGCNTSFDLTHSMGEVTNAYILLRNNSPTELTNVCATLSASDEDRTHPDRTQCVDHLPAGFQIMLKLTVDTGFQVDTSGEVDVNSSQGIIFSTRQDSCTAIGLPGWVPALVGILQPIP